MGSSTQEGTVSGSMEEELYSVETTVNDLYYTVMWMSRSSRY